ncbi:MAG: hypothetical protein IPJ13_13735 [Saprospiraceae bacterium]|nr:hypothetical protein [Saprospiraceae bacterium]
MKKFEYKVLTMDIRQGWSLTAVKLDGNSLMEKLEEYGSDDKRIKEFSELNDEIILKSGL